MMMFFSELGFLFPQFPFIAHTRGWAAEDMDNNIRGVRDGHALKEEARALAGRCVRMAEKLVSPSSAA
jgi:hypothetical protein